LEHGCKDEWVSSEGAFGLEKIKDVPYVIIALSIAKDFNIGCEGVDRKLWVSRVDALDGFEVLCEGVVKRKRVLQLLSVRREVLDPREATEHG
jgi:hypothetical protein